MIGQIAAFLLAFAIASAVGAVFRRYRIRIERRPQAPIRPSRFQVTTADCQTFTVDAPNPRAAGSLVAQDGHTIIAVKRAS
jgi:hypothetical protein